jgi:hypothetical protein
VSFSLARTQRTQYIDKKQQQCCFVRRAGLPSFWGGGGFYALSSLKFGSRKKEPARNLLGWKEENHENVQFLRTPKLVRVSSLDLNVQEMFKKA